MLTTKYVFHFQTSPSHDTHLHRVSLRWNFPRIAPSKKLPSTENFRETPRTPFRHFSLYSAVGFFLFLSIPTISRRFTSNASTYFTSRNLKKKIRSRGRWLHRGLQWRQKMDYIALKFCYLTREFLPISFSTKY